MTRRARWGHLVGQPVNQWENQYSIKCFTLQHWRVGLKALIVYLLADFYLFSIACPLTP